MFGKIDLIMYLYVTKRNWETISETTLPEHENKPNIYLTKQWFIYLLFMLPDMYFKSTCRMNDFSVQRLPKKWEANLEGFFRSSKATARIALSWMGPQRPKRKTERRALRLMSKRKMSSGLRKRTVSGLPNIHWNKLKLHNFKTTFLAKVFNFLTYYVFEINDIFKISAIKIVQLYHL